MQVKDITTIYSKRVADLTEELVYMQAISQMKDNTIAALQQRVEALEEKYEPVEQPEEEK